MKNRFEGVDLSTDKAIRRMVTSERRKINEIIEEHAALVEPVSKEAAELLRNLKEDVNAT